MKLIIATQNSKKLKELEELLEGLPLKIVSLKESGIEAEEVIEDGKTFWENAVKKAMAIAYRTTDWVLGEDSGLEVEVLDGAPGIFSARFASVGANRRVTPNDEENNQKLLELLKEVPLDKRMACYRCSVAIAYQKKLVGVTEGKCEGTIALSPRGNGGFGYDPIFIPKGYQQTFGELGQEVKQKISHRAEAIGKIKGYYFSWGAMP